MTALFTAVVYDNIRQLQPISLPPPDLLHLLLKPPVHHLPVHLVIEAAGTRFSLLEAGDDLLLKVRHGYYEDWALSLVRRHIGKSWEAEEDVLPSS